uniref:Uncharacterized protein n=1 Tax=Oryza brachyantha TaxID=4533 RepID=J3MZD3_ORYBR
RTNHSALSLSLSLVLSRGPEEETATAHRPVAKGPAAPARRALHPPRAPPVAVLLSPLPPPAPQH